MLLTATNEVVLNPACISCTSYNEQRFTSKDKRVIKCHSLRGAGELAVEKINDARENVTRMSNSRKTFVKVPDTTMQNKCEGSWKRK